MARRGGKGPRSGKPLLEEDGRKKEVNQGRQARQIGNPPSLFTKFCRSSGLVIYPPFSRTIHLFISPSFFPQRRIRFFHFLSFFSLLDGIFRSFEGRSQSQKKRVFEEMIRGFWKESVEKKKKEKRFSKGEGWESERGKIGNGFPSWP